jgi:hypothetical protein
MERTAFRRDQGTSRAPHSQDEVGLTLPRGMLKWLPLPARILLGCIKPLNTYTGLAADPPQQCAMFQTLHIHIPMCMWSVPIWQKVNGFIVLWVLSHPLREKAETGVVPYKQPQEQKDKTRDPGSQQHSRGPVPAQKGLWEEAAVCFGFLMQDRLTLHWIPQLLREQSGGKYSRTLLFGVIFFLRLEGKTPWLFAQKPCFTSLQMLSSYGKCCNKFGLIVRKMTFSSLIPCHWQHIDSMFQNLLLWKSSTK